MRRDAFTLVELLLAVALGAIVAFILAAIVHGLVLGDRTQTRHLAGPVAARSALLRMARETSCAFAPPDPEITPLTLERPTDWGEPELRLSFYLPVPSRVEDLPGFHGVERITYEVRPSPDGAGRRDLVRLSAPCSGPGTNDVRETTLLRGPFHLTVRVPDSSNPANPLPETWPREEDSDQNASEQPPLPPSLWFSLTLPGHPPIETEALVHCAHSLEPRDPPEAPSDEGR